MRKYRILRGLKFLVIVSLGAAVLGFIVLRLWNALMPSLFGWHMLTFWQAIGLLLLTRILFGGFRGRPGARMYWRRRMLERWEQMTPEEREKFREGMRAGCGKFAPPPAAPQT